MTALAAGNRSLPTKASPRPCFTTDKLVDSVVLYENGMTFLNPATGKWTKPDGTNPALIAYGAARTGTDSFDATVAANQTIEIAVESGCFLLVSSGLTAANEGSIVYASDDQTFSVTQGGTKPILGWLLEVKDATHGYVVVDPLLSLALAQQAAAQLADPVALTDADSTSVASVGRQTWVDIPAATLSANRSYALPALASSLPGDEVIVTRLDATAHTAAFTDSGLGTATLLTMPASKVNSAVFRLNAAGTHWLLKTCGTQ